MTVKSCGCHLLSDQQGSMRGRWPQGQEKKGGDLPFPSVSVVPPRVVVLEHIDSQQVIKFQLIPALGPLLL